MTARVEDVAAALRAMGYSAGQAMALAVDPINMPRTMVEERLRKAGHAVAIQHVRVLRPVGRPPGPVRPPSVMTEPPARWRAKHKAEMIRRFEANELTLEALAERFGVGAEEFEIWRQHMRRGGLDALRAKPAPAAA